MSAIVRSSNHRVSASTGPPTVHNSLPSRARSHSPAQVHGGRMPDTSRRALSKAEAEGSVTSAIVRSPNECVSAFVRSATRAVLVRISRTVAFASASP